MTIEKNVVYGMYSGLALLMDVYVPEAGRANGYGIVHISGSGWSAPLGLDARQLKDASHVEIEALPLVEAGYTVCTINHRATPRFAYPAAVEDAQRAVRFMRHNAARFGIRKDRIGAIGGSSGGHLVSMLGVLDGEGDPEDESAVNRESARVQCVVARAAPTSFLEMAGRARGAPALFLGAQLNPEADPGSIEQRRAVEASPITHVGPDAPPFLLIHGDADETVPYAQSEAMEAALRKAGVPVGLVKVPGGVHGPGIVRGPEIAAAIREWFDQHLKQ
ncbi:MAG TPA: alpha/beta hydrolase [Chloroflexota bacterium]|nr:alpha/beta hydrolase [Chloroflexota bacterium]